MPVREAAVIFMLGTHQPHWAWNGKARGPLFLSAARLRSRKSPFPSAQLPAGAQVCIDSGGYSEIHKHGRWTVPAADYAALVRRVSAELGSVGWAAIQDWMCEPWMLTGGRGAPGTGLTVEEHQRRTTASLLELRALAPDVHWLPVLQGQTLADYLAHVEGYGAAGVDLLVEPTVGVGSVCRRQSTEAIGTIVRALHGLGLSLHGFGVKAEGLSRYAECFSSTDSTAWSYAAREEERKRWRAGLPRVSLANSQDYAEAWRNKMLAAIANRKTYQLAIGW